MTWKVLETDGRLSVVDAKGQNACTQTNARLIAAAPELLAALKRSEQYLIVVYRDLQDRPRDGSRNLEAIVTRDLEMVRAALAKAGHNA